MEAKELENDINREEEGQGESGIKILNSRTLCMERILRLTRAMVVAE